MLYIILYYILYLYLFNLGICTAARRLRDPKVPSGAVKPTAPWAPWRCCVPYAREETGRVAALRGWDRGYDVYDLCYW